jgi:hypothetical protein
MKTLETFMNESTNTGDLAAKVKLLDRSLGFAAKYATPVGFNKTMQMQGDNDGMSHMRKARQAVKDIENTLSQLNSKWNGMLQ